MCKPLIQMNEYENIINLYRSGLSQAKIGELYNVRYNIIGTILRKCDVKCRDDSHKSRKYTINENYFDSIDTPNKAYILGLLFSDGCNYPPQHRVKLELQEKDKDILDKINIEIDNYEEKIYEFIQDNNLNFEKIIKYARDTKNKKVFEILYVLAR